MSALDIPAGIEASIINSLLNSFVLFIFLMGMYTVIYFGTIYVHFRKNPSKYHPVPAVMTTLFLSIVAQTAVQWYTTKLIFVNAGGTRQSVFLAVLDDPSWEYIAFNVFNCITFSIADGLLIWRCFYVWNRSFRIISLSLLLLITEIALYLAEISLDAKYSSVNVSIALAIKIGQVLAAAFFMSFSTTLVTTLLIAYRIYSVLKHHSASSRRFKHIVDIVVQSGAVYALSQLAAAISDVVPGSIVATNTRNFAFQAYTQTLITVIAGISPTVMVARVALLSADTTHPSTSVRLSGLQFHARSTHPTVDMQRVEITHSVNGNRVPDGEGQENEGQVQ